MPRPRDSSSFQAAPIQSHARLHQHARVAVDDARDEGTELHALRLTSDVAELRIRLDHGVGRRPENMDLEEVVHGPEAVYADLFRPTDDA
jgi:hypothetical protein